MPSYTCHCGARYRFGADALGKKGKCKECGAVFTLESDVGVIPLSDEGVIPLAKDDSMGGSVVPLSGTAITASTGAFEARAADVDVPLLAPGFIPPKVIIEKPERERTYAGDLIESLWYTFRLGNALTFFLLWFFLTIGFAILRFSAGLGTIRLTIFSVLGWVVIFGWYSAFRFEVIAAAAAGESDLPDLTPQGDWVDGYISPFCNWVGSWLIVMIPAIVGLGLDVGFANLSILDVVGILTGDISGGVALAIKSKYWFFLGGLALGLFFWPIVVLCFALGGASSLGRLDLIIDTTIKTFPVYLLTVLIMYVTVALEPLGEYLPEGFLNAILLTGFGLYLELIALRAVGLYYHHFKDKFAWSWG